MNEDRRPHSRACGWRQHEHGTECHANCPTCGGQAQATGQTIYGYPKSEIKKYGVQRRVTEDERKCSPIDLLQEAEERALSALAARVHHDRRIGINWPTVTHHPMWRNLLDELEDCDPEDATEWLVQASVMTVPK